MTRTNSTSPQSSQPRRRQRSETYTTALSELPPSKRQRLRTTSPSSTTPSEATGTSAGKYYGIGDNIALLDDPSAWVEHNPSQVIWRESEVHLDNYFTHYPHPKSLHPSRVSLPRPTTDANLPQHQSPIQPDSPKARFASALKLVREVIGTEQQLSLELAQSYEKVREWRERWGYSPLRDTISPPHHEAPPPYPGYLPQQGSSPSSDSTSSISPLIPNPPIPGDPAPSLDAIYQSVQTFAKANGFAVTKTQGYKYKGRFIRYTLLCDRYGEPRQSESAGLRNTQSRKCGCKWKVIAEALEEGKWLLREHAKPEHHYHNHPPSIDPSAHPSLRKLTGPVKESIESTSQRVGIRARDVRAVVSQQHPEAVLTRKDVYNARAAINRDKLDGYSSTAALIKSFDERGISYVAKWADDEPNRLVGLVWTYPFCAQMWKRFSEVISFDNTYNTNRYKLHLFQVTGQTCLGTVFNAAFGVIDNERLEGFQFLFGATRELANKLEIRLPDVGITDFDSQMKSALDEFFPDTQQQLCIHHINSNVLLNAKKLWKRPATPDSNDRDMDSDSLALVTLDAGDREVIQSAEKQDDTSLGPITHDYRGVLVAWRQVMFAKTEELHDKAWVTLCKEFNDQARILAYLYHTYLPYRAQWAQYHIRRYRNFGIRVTSGTEASNNNVKSYLLNGMSHLYRLVEAVEDMVQDQERDFKESCANDEVLTAREYSGPGSEYLGELPAVISQKGLRLITTQYRLALRAFPSARNPNPPFIGSCNEDCSVSGQLGIPCYHKIYEKLEGGTAFSKWDIHPRWHIRTPSARDPYRRILDPKIVTSIRGRPRNSVQSLPPQLAIQNPRQPSTQQSSQLSTRASHSCTQQRSIPSRPRGRPPGSRNKATLERLRLEEQSQQRQSISLGAGKTTGVRASGQRVQPSVRRQRSRWECLSSSDEERPRYQLRSSQP
jgi:hypothetical protein